jgi:predicted P-loop ATPase
MSTNKMLDAALSYATQGLSVFPVTPNQKTPAGSLVANGYKDATRSFDQIKSWWSQFPNANIGLNLERSGLVCIDIDNYKTECEFNTFVQDRDLPKTLMQKSASGGTHLIYKANEDDDYPGTLCKGVDIKYRGYILLSPSTFDDAPYEWANSIEPAKAPEWLSKAPLKTSRASQTSKKCQPPELQARQWPQDINELLGIIHEDGWHNTVLRYVGHLVAKGVKDPEIHKITDQLTLETHGVDQTRQEVQVMIDGARSKGFGSDLIKQETAQLITTSHGNIASNHFNVSTILSQQSPWNKVFAYNEFADRKMVITKPPGERGNPSFFKPRDVKDSDYTKVIKWLNQNGFPTVSKQVVIDCVEGLCEDNIISPVRHYLEGLKFDPVSDKSQLSTWMEIYLGVKPKTPEEEQYVRAVSRLSLIQAVARALSPGCKADSVPILEGGQGLGKSTALRALCGTEWFGDALPPMGTKDASDYLRGKWFIEFAELAYQRKADIETQKAFISKCEERFRPAYGREEIFHPRTCVFWGTTNRTDYLKDETGNRRFLPVRVTQVDIEGLKANRDKLWAEAVHYYRAGENYWLEGKLSKYAEQQANERFEEDPWIEVINEKLSSSEEVSLRGAIEECFVGIDAQNITQQMTRRMSVCLQMAGWIRDGRFTTGERRNQARYVRGPEAGPVSHIAPDEFSNHDF